MSGLENNITIVAGQAILATDLTRLDKLVPGNSDMQDILSSAAMMYYADYDSAGTARKNLDEHLRALHLESPDAKKLRDEMLAKNSLGQYGKW